MPSSIYSLEMIMSNAPLICNILFSSQTLNRIVSRSTKGRPSSNNKLVKPTPNVHDSTSNLIPFKPSSLNVPKSGFQSSQLASTKTDMVSNDRPTTETAPARRELSDIDKSTRIKWVLAPHPNVAPVPTPSPEAIIAPTHPSQASVADFSDYLNGHTGYDPCKAGGQSGAADDETRSRRGVSLSFSSLDIEHIDCA